MRLACQTAFCRSVSAGKTQSLLIADPAAATKPKRPKNNAATAVLRSERENYNFVDSQVVSL